MKYVAQPARALNYHEEVEQLMQLPKFRDLQKMSDKDLIKRLETMEGNAAIGINFIYDELRDRKLGWLTLVVLWLTAVVTLATIINVWLVYVSN